MPENSLLILAFGEGGHHAQARRLMGEFSRTSEPVPSEVLSLTDRPGLAVAGSKEIVFRPLREKHRSLAYTVLSAGLVGAKNALSTLNVLRASRKAKSVLFISLGPAFVALPALAVRLSGGTVVHIETWSRFSSQSMCGRIMYRIAHHFLVQSPTLLPLYPKARYVGRL